jgi:hypothetical protein
MISGNIKHGYYEVTATETEHELESGGWSFPTVNEHFDENGFPKTMELFNKLINDGKTKRAQLSQMIHYSVCAPEHTRGSVCWFILAHFNCKAQSFEHYATSENKWKK